MTTDPQKIKRRLSDVTADVCYMYQEAVCCINALQAEVSDLKQDRDEAIQARKNQTAHLESIAVGSIPAKSLRVGNFATPRVITADELKVGQTVAVKSTYRGTWHIGVVSKADEVSVCFYREGSNILYTRVDGSEFVLLADAPDEQQEPERLTVRWSGERRGEKIDPADIRDGDVVDKWVEGVRVAQDVTFDGNRIKDVFFYNDDTDEFRLVHRPDPAPVTAETIRESEPGSTWDDREGDTWEWDGEGLREQFGDGLGQTQYDLDGVIDNYGPLTRSTAAPRGDYGKKELPTTAGELILVTGYNGADMPEPIPCIYDTGDQSFISTDWAWIFQPDQITGWKPAKVVTDA